jgi:hypothetical protein
LIYCYKFRANTEAAKGSLAFTSGLIRSATGASADTLPPLDLTFLRNAVLQEWFLKEEALLGATYVNGYVEGIYSLLLDLDRMNNYIEGYNRLPSPNDKEKLKKYLKPWKEDHMKLNHILEFLNRVVAKCEAFMKEKEGI